MIWVLNESRFGRLEVIWFPMPRIPFFGNVVSFW